MPASPGNRLRLRLLLASGLALIVALTGCTQTTESPEHTRERLTRLLPASLHEREEWAADIQYALGSLKIEPSNQNLCSVLAVIEQESTFQANPPVPGLGKIALKEIEARAQRYHVPAFAVRAALQLESPTGDSWQQRIAQSRTEKELSDVFEEMTAKIPMGRTLLAKANPVRTGGPMQVSIAYAEAHARYQAYPYATEASIRHEVFTRRGGLYFGIAHLLDYPASYQNPMFRFADFNAGHYASRNAAFQNAVAVATGMPLDLDGDLVRYAKRGKNPAEQSATEAAVLKMAADLGMETASIQADLRTSHQHRFEKTELYRRVFEIADARNGKPLPHATLPRIELKSPKMTRKLTTEWFATRVNRRYKHCMQRAERGA